jgi:group I intron endonuclease
MNNNIGIYKLTAPNEKVYIGASTDLERRKQQFLACRGYRATMFEAMKEFHPSTWVYEKLCTCPKSALDVCERFYIDMFKSDSPEYGYNSQSGGRIGFSHSEETKKKMSESTSGQNHPMFGRTGDKNPWFGKKHSDKAKVKMSENSSMLGKFGVEHNRSRAVNQYDKQGNFIRRWDSIMDVDRELSIAHQSIVACCKGRRKSAGGFRWTHADADVK